MFRAVTKEQELAQEYSLNFNRYKIIDFFTYKGHKMFLQESRTDLHFCVHYCGNGHYFDTVEDAQTWTLNRTKGRRVFKNLTRD